MITIQDLIHSDDFPDLTLVAGKEHQTNQIKSVNILENPGILDWLQPGELLLTTGYAFKHDPHLQKELLIALAKQSGAGIGFKVQRYFDNVPKELIDLANEIGLPIIVIPYHYTFSQIYDVINKQLHTNYQINQTQQQMAMHYSHPLVEQGPSVQVLLEKLAKTIGCSTLVLDPNFQFLHSVDLPKNPFRISSVLSNHELNKEFTNQLKENIPELIRFYQEPFSFDIQINHETLPLHIQPILKEKKVYCYLVIWNTTQKLSLENIYFIQSTSHFLLLQLQIEHLENQVASENRHHLFFDIVKKKNVSSQDIQQFCTHYQFNESSSFTVMTLRLKKKSPLIKPEDKKPLYYFINYLLGGYKEHIICIDYRETYIFVIQHLDSDQQSIRSSQERIARTILEKMTQRYPALLFLMTISNALQQVTNLAQGYEENKQLLPLVINKDSEQTDGSSYLFFHDIRLKNNLQNLVTKSAKESLITEFLGPLINEQPKNNDYLDTLSSYFLAQRNITQAAKNMHLHRNTLTQRLKKIEDLLMISLDKTEDALALELCLYLYNELE